MIYLLLGTQILIILTAVFYLVFLSFVFYWSEAKAAYLVVPLFYTIKFFLIGFLVMIALALLLEYVPQLF